MKTRNQCRSRKRGQTFGNILSELSAKPMTIPQLAESLGVYRQTVHAHMATLRDAGAVEIIGYMRKHKYGPGRAAPIFRLAGAA